MRTMIRLHCIAAVAALSLMAALPIAPAEAQQDNLTGVATITNTAAVPGTTYAMGTPNTSAKGVFCTFKQASEVGSPSTVISVEAEDSASGAWQTLASAAAVSISTATSSSVEVYPGAVATSVPTGLAIAGLKLPKIWRLKQVITGGTSSTGSANCDLLN